MIFDLKQIHRCEIAKKKKIIKGMNKNLTTRKIFPVLLLYSPQRGNIINVRQ